MSWRAIGQGYARLATDAVVRSPRLWRLFRRPLRFQFERLASTWGTRADPARHRALEEALSALGRSPRRVLDIGSGTGAAAVLVARRWPEAEVVGIDLAGGMVAEARRRLAPDLAGRVRFEQADAARLPYEDEGFDLVVLANAIPFFDELARVCSASGAAVFSFSHGPRTPIFVGLERVRRELGQRNFTDFAEFSSGGGLALLARRARPA